MLSALSFSVEAQPPKKVPRIGYLASISPSGTDDAFRHGLRELGYVEGQNLTLTQRRNVRGPIERGTVWTLARVE